MADEQTDLNQEGGQVVPESEVRDVPNGEQEAQMPSAEVVTPTEESEVEDSIPEDSSERTKREFEKLKESNRKLKEQLESQEKYGESVYDSLYGQSTTPAEMPAVNTHGFSQPEVNNVAADFIDAEGNVDIQGLNQALREAKESAAEARRIAEETKLNTRRSSEQQQVAEAHSKHSWLDPKSTDFDPEGYKLVRDRAVANLATGSEQSLTAIADDILRVYTPKTTKATNAKETQVTKEAASVTRGSGQPRQERTPLEDLRQATLRGDSNAIDERIALATGA